jgi:hypothetical protein
VHGDDESIRRRLLSRDSIALASVAAAIIAVIIVSLTAPSHVESALTGLAALTISLGWAREDRRS